MLTFINQSFFGKSVGSLQQGNASYFSTEFEFCAMNLRYLASKTLNLSWEVLFFMIFSVAMTDLYTVIFKT